MDSLFKTIANAGVTAPTGFWASGVFCDVKELGTGKGSNKGQKKDLALLFSEVDAHVAGMFTTNQVCAAPVKLCISRVHSGLARGVVINSGNANACTGEQGMADAVRMTEIFADLLEVDSQKILAGSTGRIGVKLPMENVEKGIHAAFEAAGITPECGLAAAEAIMTSDTAVKELAVEFNIGEKTVRIGGMCKGAGMIHPGMSATGKRPAAKPRSLHATMLAFLTTDVSITPGLLQLALEEAVAASFNRISVDGDMSTNDTVLAFANGMAGNETIESDESDEYHTFLKALSEVCLSLAHKIVRDGEGVSRFITIKLDGAETQEDADAAVRAVANSVLVKTSWYGADPNWGRILDALGYSSAYVNESKVDLAYSMPGDSKIIYVLKGGQPVDVPLSVIQAITKQKEFDLHIQLNVGKARTRFYTSDLTEEYVDFNKGE
ncbi:MAG: bifunctional glutamate N-acetyltransferase/amino-acid acetyltransferase ArgJ [Limisphaerales bacterium]|nr:bifunctional glutamate N-acetyltransferase/amino-acid acetyltransferase ArgJ [Verrucomicrobiota bacterium]